MESKNMGRDAGMCSRSNSPENKKEVKTGSFSPPGVGGVLHDKALKWHSRPALPGRSAASLAHCAWQFVRRLTTKELVFLRFVALEDARVNGKKSQKKGWTDGKGATLVRLRLGGVNNDMACAMAFERLAQ